MHELSYLCLDIDGVLQTPALGEFVELEHLPLLEDWLLRNPCVQVIVTSPPFERATLENVQRLFSARFSRILALLPLTQTSRSYGGRQTEIEDWMARHAPRAQWAALDDEALSFQPGCPHLVQVHPWTGLLPEHLEQVERILARKTPLSGAASVEDPEGFAPKLATLSEKLQDLGRAELSPRKSGKSIGNGIGSGSATKAPFDASSPKKTPTASKKGFWERVVAKMGLD